MARRRKEVSPEIIAIQERCVIDVDDFDWWLGQKGWSWQGIDRGDYGLTLDQAQLLYVCEDPVLWARTFMNDPDAGDEPWTFFDYQEESVRSWHQDVVHQDGAEVGKTREIVVLILWGMCTGFGGAIRHPWMMVGAPQQTHLDEIIMAVEAHVGVDEESGGGSRPLIQRFWRKPKRHPHTMHRFWGPMGRGRVYYRPTGHDGEAFRGVHVNAMAIMDEAAKVKNPTCWSEFHRALKPGAIERIYSVPDGDNQSEYYRMTMRAIPDLQPGQTGMRLFRWPKTLMPHPYWSEERKRLFIDRYGGEDSPGYQRNVLGLHGQQENPVWPWTLMDANIRDLPEYRTIKLTVSEDQLHIVVTAYELIVVEGKKSYRERVIADRFDDLDDYTAKGRMREAMRNLVREFVRPVTDAVLWAGADFGFSRDPTEMFVVREVGTELQDIVRIHASGVDYYQQCELVYALDEQLGFLPRWGVDFANAGTAVVQMLKGADPYAEGSYEDRITGFQFSAAVDAVNEDGEVLTQEDKDGEPKSVRLPAKELATNLITARLQARGWAFPYDPEVVAHFTNHTAREGAKHRIFSKENDHTIDAKRALMLRKAFDEEIASCDVFGTGVYRRTA